MSVIQGNAIESGLGAYEIPNSLRFNSADSAYLNKTFGSSGSRTTWTWSGWVKRSKLGTDQRIFAAGDLGTGNNFCSMAFTSSDTLDCLNLSGGGTVNWRKTTTQVFRDPSAHFHLVFVYDSSNGTAADRFKIWMNGVRITTFSTSTDPSPSFSSFINDSSKVHSIGAFPYTSQIQFFDGYMSEVHFIDGTAKAASDFGETDTDTGVWKPKAYSGSYGTNGFYLPMTQDQIVEGFNTVLYRGNASTNKVTGVGFAPDLVWIKDRTFSSGSDHFLFDSLRTTYSLSSNTTGAETQKSSDGFTSLDADGFTLNGSGGGDNVNRSGSGMVAWCWDAGNSTVTNNIGTITSSVRANPTYGFSVVTYTSPNDTADQTVGHGLGVEPSLIIVKNRTGFNWDIYHKSLGYNASLTFTTSGTRSGAFGSTINDTVFTTKNNYTHYSTNAYVAYCFSEVSGYSKFGSYSGTGATGNTITLGFKPAFVMIKNTTLSGTSWEMFDNTRDTEGTIDKELLANSSGAEGTYTLGTFSDTGFTLTVSSNGVNASGSTYIYMAFADKREAAFWRDFSGNGNNWQPNNLDFNDSVTDTPTQYGTDTGVGAEVRGNYATWNPLDKDDGITSVTQGNLTVVTNGSNGSIKSTIPFPSGKWYWEVTSDSVSGSGTQAIGIMPQTQPPTNNMSDSGKLGYAIDASFSDRKFENGTATSYGSYTQGNGVVYMLAFDQDAGKLWYGVDGTWLASGAPATGSNPSSSSISTSTAYCAAVSDNTVSGTFTVNFGQLPFRYTAPSGFKALCTTNLPEPTILDGGDYFNAVTYTGNGSTQSITGVGFQPDWIWFKERSSTSHHMLMDAVRGIANGRLETSNTDAEKPTVLTSFDSDGFSMTTNNGTNESGQTYVAWNWKANGAGVLNEVGTIDSTVSANTTAGFSIAAYTSDGASTQTFGHGLGVTPAFVIIKARDRAGERWPVWHQSLTTNGFVALNETSAVSTASTVFQTASITNSVIAIGNNASVGNSGTSYICYAFAPIAGYSAFGSYTGNGSTDGPFVFTGFRPRYIMYKRTDSTGAWILEDTARSSYNVANAYIYANASDAEGTGSYNCDIVSNGFKIRGSDLQFNASGGTYVYAAFAENPFKYALAR